MASIIYDGVSGGGSLFAGMKFHFLHQIPSRNRWMELVEANGGVLVKLEKQADIVIADHARKSLPVGSISWTFVEKSVKLGRLESLENHRAGPAEQVIRVVGSAQPARKGRTPFTREDDRILMEWCIRAERQGKSLKGNEIYIQLEAKNPRHTSQSWRDRWVKYVSLQTRPSPDENVELEEEALEGRPEQRTPIRSRPRPQNKPVESVTQPSQPSPAGKVTSPHKQRTPSGKVSSPEQNATAWPFRLESAGGLNFTDEEDQELRDSYESIMQLDKEQLIDAWIAWAHQFPNHTAQEWCNRFNKDIKPRIENEFSKVGTIVSRSDSVENQETRQGTGSTSKTGRRSPILDTHTDQVAEKSQLPSDPGIGVPAREKKVVDPTLLDEKLFESELDALAEDFQLEVNFRPTICGRKVPLFQLWKVVMSDDFGGFDHVNGHKRWPQVARSLNFHEFRHLTAAEDLKACYSEILADFETYREEYGVLNPDMELTESQEEAMIIDQLRHTASGDSNLPNDYSAQHNEEIASIHGGDDENDDDLDYPQSSPAILQLSGKRSVTSREPFNKRRRLANVEGREPEIPSTPEHEDASRSQLTMKSSSLQTTSAIKERSIPKKGLFAKPDGRSPTARTPKPPIEPETQDFYFAPGKAESVEPDDSPLRNKIGSRDHGSVNNTPATLGSGPSQNDASTQSQTESQQAKELEEYIETHIALGYPQDIVIEALEATTMTIQNASFVMELLMDGKGIPQEVAGVWTKSDDDILRGFGNRADSKPYKELVLKHGKSAVNQRKNWLRDVEALSNF